MGEARGNEARAKQVVSPFATTCADKSPSQLVGPNACCAGYRKTECIASKCKLSARPRFGEEARLLGPSNSVHMLLSEPLVHFVVQDGSEREK